MKAPNHSHPRMNCLLLGHQLLPIDGLLGSHTELRVVAGVIWVNCHCGLFIVLKHEFPIVSRVRLHCCICACSRSYRSDQACISTSASQTSTASKGILRLRPADFWWALCHYWLAALWLESISHLKLVIKWALVRNMSDLLLLLVRLLVALISFKLVLLKIVVHLGVNLGVSKCALGSLATRVYLVFCKRQLLLNCACISNIWCSSALLRYSLNLLVI